MITERLRELQSIVGTVIPATIDPRDCNPPCAWISARRAKYDTLSFDDPTLDADIYLIGPDHGTMAALELLSDLAAALIEELGRHDIEAETIELDESVVLPDGGSPLPAFKISVTY